MCACSLKPGFGNAEDISDSFDDNRIQRFSGYSQI